MSKSKKNIVQTKNQIDKFIKELRTSDFEKYEILIWLRNIVWDTFPKVNETFKYGGIVFSLKENFGGLFVSKKHVFLQACFFFNFVMFWGAAGGGGVAHLALKTLKIPRQSHHAVLP